MRKKWEFCLEHNIWQCTYDRKVYFLEKDETVDLGIYVTSIEMLF